MRGVALKRRFPAWHSEISKYNERVKSRSASYQKGSVHLVHLVCVFVDLFAHLALSDMQINKRNNGADSTHQCVQNARVQTPPIQQKKENNQRKTQNSAKRLSVDRSTPTMLH